VALLTEGEIAAQLETLKDWKVEGNALTRVFVFTGFPEAVAFVGRLVPEAESADHHPDIAINYRRVTLRWTTHGEGGITLKDVDGARMAERQARPPAG
jgi:4a-hydroxytetrahydrobiopterin dehydratase